MKQESVNIQKKPWQIEEVEWREVRLGEIVKEVKSGFALSKEKRRKIDDRNGVPQLRPNNILNFNEINLNEITFVPKEIENIADYFIKKGDVLFNNTNSIELVGRAVLFPNIKGTYTYSNHITRIRVKDDLLNPAYLSWYLNLLWSKGYFFMKATKWIGQAGISNKKLLIIKILLPFRNGKPDLETQKKIVEYIEANFSKIDSILEKKKKILSQLHELWESALKNAFKPREGEEWREVRFNKLISQEKYEVGKVKVRNGLTDSGKIPVVDQGQELIGGYLDNEELKYKGPLPVIIFGDHTKVVKFIDFPFVVGADGVKILTPNKDLIYPKFFYWLLNSVKLPEKGYARHFKFLKQNLYLIPFRNGKPDLERQKEIADYLDGVYEKIKSIIEKVKSQISQLDEMKESILNEVFSRNKGK